MCVQHKEANLWHVIYSTMTNLSSVAPPEEGYSLTLPPTTRVYHHCRLPANLYLPPVHFLLSLATPACLPTYLHTLLPYLFFCTSSLQILFPYFLSSRLSINNSPSTFYLLCYNFFPLFYFHVICLSTIICTPSFSHSLSFPSVTSRAFAFIICISDFLLHFPLLIPPLSTLPSFHLCLTLVLHSH